ncbi:MAG: hypothetical protein HYR91_08700 [Flavobacteriia bacterium]|nr:hypothetical protein [Flavobacteriia bacterium]
MSTDFTTMINRYLSNELSDSEKATFEKELAQNKNLQKELAFQQEIIEGIQRATTRLQIQKIGKSYHFYKGITSAGITLVIILAISLLSYLIYTNSSSTKSQNETSISSSLIEQLEAIAPIENLASEFFEWKGNDSIVLSKSGVLLSIPENAFLLNGKPYNQNAIIQWQEAKDATTIVKSGLSTMADDRLLETQGMFGFQAYTEKGEKLTVNPKVGVYVQTPVNEYKKDMQLFSGEKGKDGLINWTNPKPLEKIPVSVDMKNLDFYPKGYETKLDALKKPTNKKYRDSLYLSFDEINNYSNTDSLSKIFGVENINQRSFNYEQTYLASNSNLNQIESPEDKVHVSFSYEKTDEYVLVKCYLSIIDNWKIGAINTKSNSFLFPTILKLNNSKDYNIVGSILGPKPKYQNDENNITYLYYDGFIEISQKIKPLKDKNIVVKGVIEFQTCNNTHCLYPYSNQFTIAIPNYNTTSYIHPSKVLAFWKPEFNNTLLATREFEKRMATIHSTCDEKLLDLYTSDLSKSMKSLDEKAVKMGYKQFNEYVSENIGAVNPDSPHYKNLERFYKNAIEQLKEEAISNQRKQQEKDDQWDEDLNNERNNELQRTSNRENKALIEEFKFNLENVEKQLGKTLGFKIIGISSIYNLDKYVIEGNIAKIWNSTVKRKTTTITDPETGKTAKITYNPFSFQVKNNKNYPKLFAYLFPSQLNSYQRISPINGKFDYPLNNDIDYDLCIVGISDKGYFYQEKKGVKKGNLGELNLTELSEKELDKKINSLNEARGIIEKMPIGDELAWLYKEQKNYVVQKQRKENEAFRNTIRKVIFPCWVENFAVAVDVTDTTEIESGL